MRAGEQIIRDQIASRVLLPSVPLRGAVRTWGCVATEDLIQSLAEGTDCWCFWWGSGWGYTLIELDTQSF